MPRELTIIVPAYNEEDRLAQTVREILHEAAAELDAFEVIIVNDGSADGTGAVAERLAQTNPAVSVVHQPVNCGVGAAYRAGLQRAQFAYFTLIPGDNAFHRHGIRAVFACVGSAELILTHRVNTETRTRLRRFLSAGCTLAVRVLTGRPIQDAHGMYVFPVALARRFPVNDGYGYHLEALTTFLHTGTSYVEIPVHLNPRPDASSGVMSLPVLAALLTTLGRIGVKCAAQAFRLSP